MPTKTNAEEVGRYTQSQALQEVATWSVDRPDWQRDALRQLDAGANVDEIYLDRLEALCVGKRDDVEFQNEAAATSQGTGGEAVTISAGVKAIHDFNEGM